MARRLNSFLCGSKIVLRFLTIHSTGARQRRLWLPLLCLALVGYATQAHADPPAETQLQVVSDFPGGAVAVQEIDQEKRVIRLEPPRLEGRGWVVWWYFKVTG